MKITADTRPIDIEGLKPYAPYLMYKSVLADRPAVEMTFAQMHQEQPTWDVESMIRGVERLLEAASQRKVLYDVYQETECADDPEKKDVKLFFLPSLCQPSDKPFILCVAGGAYTSVCSIVESFPVAARFNELGYPVFVFNYRVGNGVRPVLPKPEEDLSAAMKFILGNKSKFGITNEEYVVNGYSAGGSVTTIFGTERNGWAKYGCPRPKALFPIYPVISTSPEFMEEPSARNWFKRIMFGGGYEEAYAASYDVPGCMTDDYPPCYIVQAKDDPLVSIKHSIALEKLLKERGIPVHLECIERGGHGWGDGSGTDAAGWPDRAIQFLDKCTSFIP